MDKDRISSFDSLRGIAILSVIIHHSYFMDNPNQFHQLLKSAGRYGVQLFFIISGIMVTHSWYKKEINLKLYFFNRMYRILPLFILSGFIYNLNNLNLKTFKLMMIVTSHFITPGNNNIDTAAPGGWSIVSEIFFYFLFPCLFLIKKQKNIYYFFILQSITFITYNFFIQPKISTYMFSLDLPQADKYIQNYLFFNFINQLPIFLLGIGLYFCLFKNESLIKFYSLQFLLVGFCFLVKFGVNKFSTDNNLLQIVDSIQINFFLFYIFLSLLVVFFVKLNISIKYLSYVGIYSYGMYIFHYFGAEVANFLKIALPEDNYFYYFICLFVMIITSLFLARIFEDFLLRKKSSIKNLVGL